ncbi:MAG: class E sortase [Acidimicrobiia bacterium]|nr:class E sortase [Acidimicrobiia bacterium]
MIWVGVYLLGFVAYQLWFTNLLTARDQAALAATLESRFAQAEVQIVEYRPGGLSEAPPVSTDEAEPPEPGSKSAPDNDTEPDDVTNLLLKEGEGVLGEAFAQLRIPAIGLDVTLVEGVRRRDLKKGPGHLTGTPVPGQPGSSVISGHRTTYGAPFGSLNELLPGDRIEVDTAIGTHIYEVREAPDRCRSEEGLCVVEPTGVWVTEPRAGAWLTLTTCHPKFSSRRRLIVFSELIDGPNVEAIRGSA